MTTLKFSVSPAKGGELERRMAALGVREEDFREIFIRSSGPGGQKVNRSATCVFLVHEPTGLSVKCQTTRSQAMNRFLARRRILDRLEALREGAAAAEKEERERIRRQKRRRSRKAKAKVREGKQKQSAKKALRAKVTLPHEF
ncbi:MAG TPA: peptide chain release factor-like protein [Syntrophales bacterium]|nr:peptide chain release factor-like protein [Syntrophales bacterium]HPX11464.1 peptide chain release factor-like protein [Syntrophales bacterium]HQB31089.1 peptide chain release factor-like protein [Syntrophales bacterium]HQN77923.1 peptide chain release factor-like protein [Syntrophales bacterium]HQQ28255.1 peptide chain release factor-like protein [Syntrophales bacterium]